MYTGASEGMSRYLDDMLDRIHDPRPSSHAIVPPVGPRTLGSEDTRWTRECDALFDIDRAVEDSQRKRVTTADVNDLMVAIVAKAHDPTIIFSEDKAVLTLEWVTGSLKVAFQTMRMPFKKPWPEFLAALMNPTCLSREDCSVLSALFGVNVGHVRANGDLVIPQSLLDADFDHPLIDARSATETNLGALLGEARERRPIAKSAQTMSEIRKQANALAICAKHDTRAVLSSKIASRGAALDERQRQHHRPTSN
jgi:hypothetical protein